MNHGHIGAKIAEKWHFPDSIVSVIRFHHSPENSPQEYRKLTSLVYLADLMIHYQEREVAYYQIDKNVLAMFNIKSEEQFQKIGEKLSQAFIRRTEDV